MLKQRPMSNNTTIPGGGKKEDEILINADEDEMMFSGNGNNTHYIMQNGEENIFKENRNNIANAAVNDLEYQKAMDYLKNGTFSKKPVDLDKADLP